MRPFAKIFRLFIVTVILSGLFAGLQCDKGTDSEKTGSIIGSWRMATVIMKDTPVGNLTLQAEDFLELSGTGATTSTLQFNEDGSAALTTTYTDGSEEVVPGAWTTDGSELNLEGAGIDDTVLYDVDGNTLTLTIILPIDFDSDGTTEDTEVDMIYNRL